MLRLKLDAADLANLRVSGPWGPLAESLFSLVSLQRRRPTVLTVGWRQRVLRDLGDDAIPLLALMRPSGIVDLHTLIGQVSTVDEGLDALNAAPEQFQRELLWALPARVHREQPWVRAWLRRLADGDAQVRRDLVAHLRDYHDRAVGPYWERIQRHLEADHALRARVMVEGGLNQLLATLHPAIRWRPPFLEVRRRADWSGPPAMGDYVSPLEGRSLILVPSACVDHPTVYGGDIDAGSPDVLFYPTLQEPTEAAAILVPETTPQSHALGMLFGDTRAAALHAITDPCTTTELARRVGVSPATASHHARTLREAGLVTTRRVGQAVLHSITPIGTALLNGDPTSRASSATRPSHGRLQVDRAVLSTAGRSPENR